MVAIEEGSVITGKYRLERLLARGGMGSVWIGRHLELGVTVAVKFIDSGHATSDSARTRFKREAKAAAQLKTPNVVQVYDYGVQDDTPYIVMELLEGEDLGTRLTREGRLSAATVAAILAPVYKAVHRAHEIGLVHRDLKPANIFLARVDDEVVVKVLDFGIAKWTDPDESGSATTTGMMLGSPYYMSPEQARSLKELDHRSDLWSLGVIAFRALTGQLPFPGNTLPAIVMAICVDPIPVPSQIAPDLGPEIDRFFERALARDPSQRFQSARSMAEALVALSTGSEDKPPRLPTWSAIHVLPAAGPAPAPSPIPSSPSVSGSASSTTGAATIALSPPGSSLTGGQPIGRRTGVLVTAAGAGILMLGLFAYVILRGPAPEPTTEPRTKSEPIHPSTTAEIRPSATAVAHPTPPDMKAEPETGPAAPDAGIVSDARSATPRTTPSNNTKPRPAPGHAPAPPSATPPPAPASIPTVSTPAPAPTGHGID